MPPVPPAPTPPPSPQPDSDDDAGSVTGGLGSFEPGAEVMLTAEAASAGVRLDVFLARRFPEQSRSFLARAIAPARRALRATRRRSAYPPKMTRTATGQA